MCLCMCYSQPLWSGVTWTPLKLLYNAENSDKINCGGGGSIISVNVCRWLGDAWHSPTFEVSISPVFLSNSLCSYLPIGIFTVFCGDFFVILLYLNLYLLFWSLLNLSVIWKWEKKQKQKKTPSVLKYCIAIVFNAKYYL